MPYRRAMALRPVRGIKHIVDTNGTISAAGVSVNDVIVTVDTPSLATSNECASGSTVNALFLRVDVVPVIAAGGVDNIYLTVYKNPGGDLTGPNPSAVGVSDDRRRVIHQEMAMLGNGVDQGSNISRILFKGVVLIPRGLKRNGLQDKLQVSISHRLGEATQTTRFCLQCIYKEFR